MCNGEFIAGETQIAPHPTQVGPRGGKMWVCEEHVQDNPRQTVIAQGRGKYAQSGKSKKAQDRYEEAAYEAYRDQRLDERWPFPPPPVKEFERVANPRKRQY